MLECHKINSDDGIRPPRTRPHKYYLQRLEYKDTDVDTGRGSNPGRSGEQVRALTTGRGRQPKTALIAY